MIYFCNFCDEYFDQESIIHHQPDGGSFCGNCHSDDFDLLSTDEIIERLNEGVG